jgi:transposase
VPRAFGQGGKTFVMDCKGAALGTRAFLASTGDYYLCPLTETPRSAEKRRALLQPVWEGRQARPQGFRPAEPGEGEELVAEGFSLDVPLQADVDGQPVTWTERRWVVRSLAFAAGQHQQLDRRLQTAEEELAGLNERQPGKRRLSAQERQAAAEPIVKKQRVEGLLSWQVRATTRQRTVRGYGDRPERVEKEPEHWVAGSRGAGPIAEAKRDLGWRGYAANQLSLNLAGVVWGYRGQNRLEDNWSRLKGQPLGLTPRYWQHEGRIQGLVRLLSLGLRLLSVLEWTVRKKRQESKQTLRGL